MSKKILVVDDEPDVVTYLSTVLKDAGYETLEASNGEEAIEQVRTGRPDLVTLDITMPEMTGVKTYRTLKESAMLRTIPVIIVTGVAHDFKQFISTRAQVPPPEGYLEKPVAPESSSRGSEAASGLTRGAAKHRRARSDNPLRALASFRKILPCLRPPMDAIWRRWLDGKGTGSLGNRGSK